MPKPKFSPSSQGNRVQGHVAVPAPTGTYTLSNARPLQYASVVSLAASKQDFWFNKVSPYFIAGSWL